MLKCKIDFAFVVSYNKYTEPRNEQIKQNMKIVKKLSYTFRINPFKRKTIGRNNYLPKKYFTLYKYSIAITTWYIKVLPLCRGQMNV